MTVFVGQKTTWIDKGPGTSTGNSPFSFIGTGSLGAIKAHMTATIRVCMDEDGHLWMGFDSLRIRTYTTLIGSFFPLCFAWGNNEFRYNPKGGSGYTTFIRAGVTNDSDPSTAWSDLAILRHTSGTNCDWSLSGNKSSAVPLNTNVNPSNYNLYKMGHIDNVVHLEEDDDGTVRGYVYMCGTYNYAGHLNDPDYAQGYKIYFEGVEEFYDYYPWARYLNDSNHEADFYSHNRRTPEAGSLMRFNGTMWTKCKNKMPENKANSADTIFRYGTSWTKSPKLGKNK